MTPLTVSSTVVVANPLWVTTVVLVVTPFDVNSVTFVEFPTVGSTVNDLVRSPKKKRLIKKRATSISQLTVLIGHWLPPDFIRSIEITRPQIETDNLKTTTRVRNEKVTTNKIMSLMEAEQVTQLMILRVPRQQNAKRTMAVAMAWQIRLNPK